MGSDEIVQEDHFEPIRIPKGKEYVVIVFAEKGSEGFNMTTSNSIHAGQLFAAAGFLDEQARGIIRAVEYQRMRQMSNKEEGRIIKPGRA